MTEFYIVRHGQTEWNIKGLLQGHKDSPLTEQGINQAKEQGVRFKDVQFDGVFSSDLLRARRTAEVIAQERKLEVMTTKLLRERSFGQYEGRESSIFQTELKELFDLYKQSTDDEKRHFRYPTVETDDEIIGRFLTFLCETALAYEGKTVLVVSHSGMISNLLVRLGYFEYKEKFQYHVGNDCYIKLNSIGVEFEIKEVVGVIKR